MKKKIFIILGIIFLFSAVLFFGNKIVEADEENDAIAVRIIPNPDHYSITRWYEKQGFTGSPQTLIVDGYEAVRDGRTVYIGAANRKGSLIYTNIYLISYNQEPSNKTVDILGKIVKKWKFNTDLETATVNSHCTISSSVCLNNSDCASEQVCASSGVASSSCQLKASKSCLLDSDCPENFFCDSPKAKIIRDLNRISLSQELDSALNQYKDLNGFYPKLEAGTYLSQNTVSVWPSWSETFLSALGLKSFKDPINRLGSCPGYDPTTCWNKDTKKFVYDSQANELLLPAGSYGFIYRTDINGSDYSLCSVMETKALGYTFEPNNFVSSNCVTAIGALSGGVFTNTAPRLVDFYLKGEAGEEFNGSIKVVDDEGNPLKWTFSTNGQTWTNWSSAPIFKETNNPNLKKVYAAKAGDPGAYKATLTVSDGQGGTLSTTTPIIIENTLPFIEAEDAEFTPSASNKNLNYSFYITDSNFIAPSKNKGLFLISKVSGSDDFNFSASSYNFLPAGENRYRIDYQVPFISNVNLLQDKENIFRITVWDSYSAQSIKDIKLKIKADAPSLNFNCQSSERLGYDYSCLLGPVSQNNHTITYSLGDGGILPSGLKFITNASSTYLSGKTIAEFGETNDANDKIIIKATNEYGAFSSKTLPLQVNSYCGDKKKQYPNTEGRGGAYNDGYEDCDYRDGTTGDISLSNSSRQYGCSSGLNWTTPYPILTNNYCVFKSPVDGGGYCGDGYCQVKIETLNGVISEDGDSCPADCVSVCVPRCDNKNCGDDGCGGFCQPNKCSEGNICTKGSCCPTSANIQVSVDNYHTTYFDGAFVFSTENPNNEKNHCSVKCNPKEEDNNLTKGCCWKAIQEQSVKVIPGKNVLAIKAVDSGDNYGLAATLNQKPCNSMTTSSTTDWKCTTVRQSNSDWTKIDFDDSSWPSAVSTYSTTGNALADDGVGQIWASGAGSGATIYCRYTFTSLANSDMLGTSTCVPNCADYGRKCGSDGCGGTCGSCSAGKICSEGQCVSSCSPVCESGYCGPDGCGGTCGCGADKNCVSGQCISCTDKETCGNKKCGVDGCGRSCGTCPSDYKCSNGACVKS